MRAGHTQFHETAKAIEANQAKDFLNNLDTLQQFLNSGKTAELADANATLRGLSDADANTFREDSSFPQSREEELSALATLSQMSATFTEATEAADMLEEIDIFLNLLDSGQLAEQADAKDTLRQLSSTDTATLLQIANFPQGPTEALFALAFLSKIKALTAETTHADDMLQAMGKHANLSLVRGNCGMFSKREADITPQNQTPTITCN